MIKNNVYLIALLVFVAPSISSAQKSENLSHTIDIGKYPGGVDPKVRLGREAPKAIPFSDNLSKTDKAKELTPEQLEARKKNPVGWAYQQARELWEGSGFTQTGDPETMDPIVEKLKKDVNAAIADQSIPKDANFKTEVEKFNQWVRSYNSRRDVTAYKLKQKKGNK
ncbi:hypothetical protein GW916_15275 [bacterium]|nr:hypothetical protein [bacterium]